MRRLLLVTLIVACSHAPSGPAWPKATEPETDGGESLAPHVARASSTAATTSIDDDDDEKVTVTTPSATSPTAATPEKKAEPPILDDPLFDDFTIEIEE